MALSLGAGLSLGAASLTNDAAVAACLADALLCPLCGGTVRDAAVLPCGCAMCLSCGREALAEERDAGAGVGGARAHTARPCPSDRCPGGPNVTVLDLAPCPMINRAVSALEMLQEMMHEGGGLAVQREPQEPPPQEQQQLAGGRELVHEQQRGHGQQQPQSQGPCADDADQQGQCAKAAENGLGPARGCESQEHAAARPCESAPEDEQEAAPSKEGQPDPCLPERAATADDVVEPTPLAPQEDARAPLPHSTSPGVENGSPVADSDSEAPAEPELTALERAAMSMHARAPGARGEACTADGVSDAVNDTRDDGQGPETLSEPIPTTQEVRKLEAEVTVMRQRFKDLQNLVETKRLAPPPKGEATQPSPPPAAVDDPDETMLESEPAIPAAGAPQPSTLPVVEAHDLAPTTAVPRTRRSSQRTSQRKRDSPSASQPSQAACGRSSERSSKRRKATPPRAGVAPTPAPDADALAATTVPETAASPVAATPAVAEEGANADCVQPSQASPPPSNSKRRGTRRRAKGSSSRVASRRSAAAKAPARPKSPVGLSAPAELRTPTQGQSKSRRSGGQRKQTQAQVVLQQSNLARKDKDLLATACDELGDAKVLPAKAAGASATHLVIVTDAPNPEKEETRLMAAKRTLKYFNAVVRPSGHAPNARSRTRALGGARFSSLSLSLSRARAHVLTRNGPGAHAFVCLRAGGRQMGRGHRLGSRQPRCRQVA